MAKSVTFADMIAPLTWEQFYSQYWAKSLLHQTGQKGRFTPLISWDDLNAILDWHCPPQPQVRLSLNGKPIDVRQYIDGKVGSLKLNVGGLIANLSQGASLIVDQVQDVVPNVNQLAEELQDRFQGLITANLYAGWRQQHGFDLHWDVADLFVLQIHGRKHWKVYRPTRPYPLTNDIKVAPKPAEPPVFDAIINDGDILHVPRGWWHMAFPLNEPSLHLTFGIESLHGADFVRWWAQKMLRQPEIRKNIPVDSDPSGQLEYLRGVLKLIGDEFNEREIDVFLREKKKSRRPHTRVRLPVSPVEHQQAWSMTTHVRLATAYGIIVDQEGDGRLAEFTAGGNSWSARRELIPAFERLSGHTSVSVKALCAGITDMEVLNSLMSALDQLAISGVILKEGPFSL
jgi:ribosomal protein L16 Arg81 hydroxylase